MRLIALALVFAASDRLGQPLRTEGFTIRPPATFRSGRLDLFHASHVGAATLAHDAPRYVAAVLLDGQEEDAATMLFDVVETRFELGPSARDDVSTAVVHHFRDELGLKFALDRVDVVRHGSPRVEVSGTVRASSLRHVTVAVWPGEQQHIVATVSSPVERWADLSPLVTESFETLRIDASPLTGPPLKAVWLVAALSVVALAASVIVWARVRARRA